MQKATNFFRIPQIVSASKLKTEFASLVDSLKGGSLFIVTHPDVDAVLISKEKWNELLEQMEILESMLVAEDEYENGETSSLTDLDKDVKNIIAGAKNGRSHIEKSSHQNKPNRKSRAG